MIKLLQAWHWLHTWSKWTDVGVYNVSYPWTREGHSVAIVAKQIRYCTHCSKAQGRTVEL